MPPTSAPLTNLLSIELAREHRSLTLKQIKNLASEHNKTNNSTPAHGPLKLEDLEDDFIESLESLERRLEDSGGSEGWLLGSR